MGTIEKSWLKKRYVGTGTFSVTPRVRELVNEVLDSGRISYGEKSKRFEREFARLHDCKYGILSNSGTSSLQVALQAMKSYHNWPDGKMVVVPATTFVATPNIVRHCGLVPVFVDVDPKTYNMDMTQALELIENDREKDIVAVIPVHLFGLPANVSDLMVGLEQLDRSLVGIIEDSCETMFVGRDGFTVGSMGDIACFSMYAAHLIVTGVGGMATTNFSGYAEKMRSLVNHGLDIQFLNPDENYSPQPMLNRQFIFSDYGHSYRITEMEAAIGLAQLEDHERIVRLRKRNAEHLRAGIKAINKYHDNPIQLQEIPDGAGHANMMFPIVLNKAANKMVQKSALTKWLNDHDVETRDMLPLLHQPIYSWLSPKSYPVSDWLVQSGFYVGCHQDLSPDDVQYIVDVIRWFYEKEQ